MQTQAPPTNARVLPAFGRARPRSPRRARVRRVAPAFAASHPGSPRRARV